MSIGGYAIFAVVRGPDGGFVRSGELSTTEDLPDLPPGDYPLHVDIKPASDAVTVLPNGEMRREFGPTSAQCEATLRVSPGEVTSVVITTLGGDLCTIANQP
jgi:hypothetical protein